MSTIQALQRLVKGTTPARLSAASTRPLHALPALLPCRSNTPPTSSAAGRPRPGVFSEGLAEGQQPVPWVGNVRGGKRPHAWADVGGEVKGKELQAAGGGSGHTLAARSVEELDLEGKQWRARL